jgi:hypothetical protein
MFGFGSKKQNSPETLWIFQILTTEYLVEGQLPPDKDFFSFCQTDHPADSIEILTHVQLQPAGVLSTPSQILPNWRPSYGKMIVAIIPRDNASIEAAKKAYEDYITFVRAELYAGSYLIRGDLMSNLDDKEIDFDEQSGFLPVINAEIDHLLPGAKLHSYRVPWLLLNGDLLHGYSLL